MKKLTKTLVMATLVVATVVAVFVGCKKEKDEFANNANNGEVKALMNRIEAFQSLREAVHSGAKTNGSMTLEEMQSILDLMANYEHSEHTTFCSNVMLDTLHIAMPKVDGEGNVSETDVVATYDAFETALNQRMLSVNDDLDVPSLFSIVMPTIGAKDDNNIDIVFRRGEESDAIEDLDDDPFSEGENWGWGKSLGLCKPNPFNADLGDASTQLTLKLAALQDSQHQGQIPIITHVTHVAYRPCVQEIPDVESIYYADSIDCDNSWIFCTEVFYENDPCLFYFELNCFYHSIVSHIVDPSGALHYAPSPSVAPPPYYSCYIQWHEFETDSPGLYLKIHAAYVTYAIVNWVEPGNPGVE